MKDLNYYRQKDEDLYSVAEELKGYLSPDEIDDFKSAVEHNESIVGIEILLEQIFENNIYISKKSYDILKKAGKDRIDDSYFSGIKIK